MQVWETMIVLDASATIGYIFDSDRSILQVDRIFQSTLFSIHLISINVD